MISRAIYYEACNRHTFNITMVTGVDHLGVKGAEKRKYFTFLFHKYINEHLKR